MENMVSLFNKYKEGIMDFVLKDDVIHAASDLRVLLELIVDSFGPREEYYIDKSLFDKIEYLKDNQIISVETVGLFHNIRKNTNDSHHSGTSNIGKESIKYYLNELEKICNSNSTKQSIAKEYQPVNFCDYSNINIYLNNAEKAVLKNDSSAVASNIKLVIEEICDICFDSFNFESTMRFEDKVSYLVNNDILSDENKYCVEQSIKEANKAINSHGNMDITIIKTTLLVLEDYIPNIIDNIETFISDLNGKTTIYKTKNDKEKILGSSIDYLNSFINPGSEIASVVGMIASISIIILLLGSNMRFGAHLVPLFFGIAIIIWSFLTAPVTKLLFFIRKLDSNGGIDIKWDELLSMAGKTKKTFIPVWLKIYVPIIGIILIIVAYLMSIFVNI